MLLTVHSLPFNFSVLISAAVFLIALVLVIWQPRRMNIAWPAIAGAALLIALRLVSLSDLRLIVGTTWDATLTLVALMIISATLDSNGFFTWGARRLLIMAGGSGRIAFVYIVLLTVAVTAILANDGAVLILVPIFCGMFTEIGIPRYKALPYLLTAGFLADAASTPLIASNLTNIIVADSFHLSAAAFATRMALPTAFIVISASSVLFWQYRKELPDYYDVSRIEIPNRALKDLHAFRMGWAVLILLPVGYVISGIFGIPVSVVAGTAALLLLGQGRARRVIKVRRIIARSPWYIVIYAVAMFALVLGLSNSGLTSQMNRLIASPSGALPLRMLSAALTTGAAAAGVNNLPAALVSVLELKQRATAGSSGTEP
ncbi:MAG TPA: ArsB/NhaD family transporter, partial [Blastocatellia bacterium]|nr:ArsB/NhaD family transporter [Blastocatellia bacterium]